MIWGKKISTSTLVENRASGGRSGRARPAAASRLSSRLEISVF
jgi:hypothetical protein